MIFRIPTATDNQIFRMSQGLPVRIKAPRPKCLECGRFHSEDCSFCPKCRSKHATTGTPYWLAKNGGEDE